MHANRNKKAVKRVEKGMMKANRIRNLFAVFAIVLTTFMITTVFSLGINYMENMKLMQVRTAGTTANASLAMPTEKQEQQIKNLEYVKTVGTQYMVGSVAEKNDEGRDLSIALSYYDPTEWEKHYKETIKDIEGKYPSDENEIMLSEDALSQLGMKEPKLNMEIPLSYYDKNGQQEKNFTLSGWFHSYTGTGMGFVSEAYCKNAGYTMAEDGVLSLSLNKMPDDFYRIQKDVELNENQSFGGAVSMKSSSGSVIAMVILLVFFIIGSGYLLIYNVLYISISTADSTDGKATDFKIGGAFYYDDYDNTLSEGIGRRKDIQIVPNIIFVSEAGMERLTKEPIISAIGVDIKNFNDLERIDSELQAINSTLTGSEWQLRSSVNQKELFEQMNYSLSLLGNGAAILLIVIGLINFVNVMLTGVVARKNEFAIMESIGTTKKQIMKILTLEGGIYALISTLLIMTFGNAFLMLVADAVPHMANYAVFKYPVALVIGLIAAIFVICLSVPAIVHKATSDETVIERLHNFEN